MGKPPRQRRRTKISAIVDPRLLKAVDAFVARHPKCDRSSVIDDALLLWYAREQERAMEEQLTGDSGVDSAEWESWRSIRDAAAEWMVRSRDHE